jgi:hypothetical protein
MMSVEIVMTKPEVKTRVKLKFIINTEAPLNKGFDAEALFNLLNRFKLSLVMIDPKAPSTFGPMPEVTVEGDVKDVHAFRTEFARPRFVFGPSEQVGE